MYANSIYIISLSHMVALGKNAHYIHQFFEPLFSDLFAKHFQNGFHLDLLLFALWLVTADDVEVV